MYKPIAGYTFDAQDGTDDVGAHDLTGVPEDYTASAKFGDYAADTVTELDAYGQGFPAVYVPYTLAVWLYVPAESAVFTYCDDESASSQPRLNAAVAAGTLTVYDGWPGEYWTSAIAGGSVTTGAWNLVVAGIGSDNKLYVSLNGGAIVRSASDAHWAGAATQSWAIYSDSAGVHADEWIIWDSELSQDDIDWLYNSGTGRSLADVMAYAEPSLVIDSPVSRTYAIPADSRIYEIPGD